MTYLNNLQSSESNRVAILAIFLLHTNNKIYTLANWEKRGNSLPMNARLHTCQSDPAILTAGFFPLLCLIVDMLTLLRGMTHFLGA